MSDRARGQGQAPGLGFSIDNGGRRSFRSSLGCLRDRFSIFSGTWFSIWCDGDCLWSCLRWRVNRAWRLHGLGGGLRGSGFRGTVGIHCGRIFQPQIFEAFGQQGQWLPDFRRLAGDLSGQLGSGGGLLSLPVQCVGGKQGGELGQRDRLFRGVNDSFQLGFQAHSLIGTSSMVPERKRASVCPGRPAKSAHCKA